MKLKAVLFTAALVLSATQAHAHCQIPCGIYGDMTRFDLMQEHIITIEKAMKGITALSAEDKPNYNQIVRWVNAKEDHADKIGDTVFQYFLQQRIKAGQPSYDKKLAQLHKIAVLAMKAKQSTDVAVVAELNAAVASFKTLYIESGKEKHAH